MSNSEPNPALNNELIEQLDFLQFKFLPSLCNSFAEYKKNKSGNFDESKLTNKELMSSQPLFELIDWAKIKIEKKILPNKAIEYIYDFGEDLKESLCIFSLFYVDEENNIYEYMTLERTEEFDTYPFYIGGFKNGKHLDHKVECPPDFKIFESIVQKIVEKMKEQNKLLKMYFGDNPVLHQEMYQLQFRFLPKLFSLHEEDIKDKKNPVEDKLIDIETIKTIPIFSHIDWSKFKFEKKILANGAKEFIYDFGEPKSLTLCRFAIFYVDANNGIFEYITLEKTCEYKQFPYLICGQKGPQHKNYGIECPADFNTFEKRAHEIIQKEFKPTSGFNYKKMELNIGKK